LALKKWIFIAQPQTYPSGSLQKIFNNHSLATTMLMTKSELKTFAIKKELSLN